MTPKTKKIIYGIGYFLFFVLLFYIFFNPFSKPLPSCYDNIKNQGEEDIDCGGPCKVPCYTKNALPLELLDSFVFFKDTEYGRLFVLFTIQNKNGNVGSHRFYFTLNFFDEKNNFVGSIRESSSILPSEAKSILVEYNDSIYNIERISKAEILFDDISWAREVEFLKGYIELEDYSILKEDKDLVVSGTIFNNSIFNLPKVRIIALILDKYGDVLFAGQTIGENFDSYERYNFKIFMPVRLFRNVDINNLKANIFTYVEE